MRPDHFELQELVDRATFMRLGEEAWGLLSPDALSALDGLRKFFGVPVRVNNWSSGGWLQYRGYRGPDCPVGSPRSQHRRGNAFDCDIAGVDAETARRAIIENQDDPLLQTIGRIEADVGWLHFDCAPPPPGKSRIYLFRP